MKVIKYGGILLKDKQGFLNLERIVQNESHSGFVLVISAFSGVTRKLKKIAESAEAGNLDAAHTELLDLLGIHRSFISELCHDTENIDLLKKKIASAEDKLLKISKGLSITRELTARTLDVFMSYGEYLAMLIIDSYLREQGFRFKTIDAIDFLVTDNNHGQARPIYYDTSKNVHQLLLPALKTGFVLTRGFVGRGISGEITTMGMESSNLTAALIADMINATEIICLTDSCGIRRADPKIFPNARLIESMNYQDAFIASVSGLKLIHPAMTEYSVLKGISLVYRSGLHFSDESTFISNSVAKRIQNLIILHENQQLVTILYENLRFKIQFESQMLSPLIAKLMPLHISIEADSAKLIINAEKSISRFFKDSIGIKVLIKDCRNVTIINPTAKMIENLQTKSSDALLLTITHQPDFCLLNIAFDLSMTEGITAVLNEYMNLD